MRELVRKDVTDGYSWWCPQCKGRKSIREGSFFSKSKVLVSIIGILFLTANKQGDIEAVDFGHLLLVTPTSSYHGSVRDTAEREDMH